jgi:hypothetical protein
MMMTVTATIRARLRLEFGQFFTDVGAQPCDHLAQHRIDTDAQPAGPYLRLRMAVPQVECAARQQRRVAAAHDIRRLQRGLDAHHAPAFAQQQVAIAQHRAAHEEQRDLFTRGQARPLAAALPLFERQHQRVVHDVGNKDAGMQ